MITLDTLLTLAAIALWVYAVVDVARTDPANVPLLPKAVWLLLVFLLPPFGPVAWLVFRRPHPPLAQRHPAHAPPAPTQPPRRPAPDPEFHRRREEALRRYLAEREEERRREEEALRRRLEELRRRQEGKAEG